MRNHGFSLVELSIVLVILGLLVGGILAGQSLIRASELRAVGTEYNRYVTAAHAFRDKYFYLPGDMPNAESFWGTLLVANTCRNTPTTAGTLTCNGDGNGLLSVLASPRSKEIWRFWQHLSNAGMIEGFYSGMGTTGNANTLNVAGVLGVNTPPSRLSGAGWTTGSADSMVYIGNSNMFLPSSPNWLMVGGVASLQASSDPLLRPEEAWNMDTKIDDGKPGTGRVVTFNNTFNADCASSNTAATAIYQLDKTSLACTLAFSL